MNKISIALLLGAVFAVGCGDAEKGAGSGSAKASSAPSTKSTASGGTTAAPAGGSTDDYVKAYCDCKQDAKCLSDVTVKYGEALAKNPLNADQSKKIAECTTGMAVPTGMPSGAPSAAGSAK